MPDSRRRWTDIASATTSVAEPASDVAMSAAAEAWAWGMAAEAWARPDALPPAPCVQTAAPAAFRVGTWAYVRGLCGVGAVELNWRIGRIEKFYQESGRAKLVLICGRSLAVQPTNLCATMY